MADDSAQDRTEKATQRRRDKAREEGRVARSTVETLEFVSGSIILAIIKPI